MNKKIVAVALLAFAFGAKQLPAQLAITEVMSSSQNNPDAAHSDFWELTNFGTNSLDLTDYKFTDGTGDLEAAQANGDVLDGVTIAPGESVILFEIEQNTDPADFLGWWGAANLPVGIQVRMYAEPGLGSGGDGVQLWDANDNPVDSVSFGAATRGTSFTYNTNNGAFAVLSVLGAAGAFTAGSANADIGSPGYTAGPVPLTITQQPTNFTVSAGANATFTAAAYGLPKPRYQWFFNSNAIDGATSPSLVVTNAQTNNAGAYSVLITNGVQAVASSNATLTVTPTPASPLFTVMPSDVSPTIGQNITLNSQAVGYPIPSYQWQRNDVDLPGETASQLTLLDVQTNNSGTYKVIAYNTVGTNAVSAVVMVTRKPLLIVTEVQSSEASPSAGHADWWELSNLDDHSVNLRGYRFDDGSQSIASAFAFTNDIIVRPGESIVFVQDISPEQFRAWWGTNLAANVQVVTYPDISLGLGGGGDAINLWNPTATNNTDKITFASFSAAHSPAGPTFVYQPDSNVGRLPNILNFFATNGVNGAFAATNGLDIGSPGAIVEPLILNVAADAGEAVLSWASTPNRSYTVDYKDDVAAATWTVLTNVIATGTSTVVSDPGGPGARLYRGRVNVLIP